MAKKAQGALEYLMTYGWALLIIIIIAGALYALDVFNPQPRTGIRVSGLGNFYIGDARLSSTAFSINIGPQTGKRTSITDIDWEVDTLETCNNTDNDLTDTNIGASEKATLTLTANETAVCSLTAGQEYNVDITVDYTVARSSISHSEVGTITLKAE